MPFGILMGIMKALLVGVARYLSCSSHLKGTMPLSCQSTKNDKVQTWIAIHSVRMSHPCMMLSSCHGFAQKNGKSLIKAATLTLAKSLDSYLAYLKEQRKKMALHHYSAPQSVADSNTFSSCFKSVFSTSIKEVEWRHSDKKKPYEVVHVAEYTPADRKKRYRFIQDLQKGLCKRVLCTYSVGGPVGNYHFIWLLPAWSYCITAWESVKADIPTYHNRVWESISFPNLAAFHNSLTLLFFVNSIGKQLVINQSASLTTAEKELDERLREALEMEDTDILLICERTMAAKAISTNYFGSVCKAFYDILLQYTNVIMVLSHIWLKPYL